jgi:hypothetical protein
VLDVVPGNRLRGAGNGSGITFEELQAKSAAQLHRPS